MPSRYTTDSVLAECERMARVWTDNPTFSLGEVTLAGFQAGAVATPTTTRTETTVGTLNAER